MEKIIAYAFEAALHCPACTQRAAQRMKLDHNHPYAMGESCRDDHGVEYDLVDREGNLVHPVFVTDSDVDASECCDDCHTNLRSPQLHGELR